MAFNRNAKSVNGGLVGIGALNAFAIKLAALAAFTPLYRKNSGLVLKMFDPAYLNFV